jgi:hypothetical protein
MTLLFGILTGIIATLCFLAIVVFEALRRAGE